MVFTLFPRKFMRNLRYKSSQMWSTMDSVGFGASSLAWWGMVDLTSPCITQAIVERLWDSAWHYNIWRLGQSLLLSLFNQSCWPKWDERVKLKGTYIFQPYLKNVNMCMKSR